MSPGKHRPLGERLERDAGPPDGSGGPTALFGSVGPVRFGSGVLDRRDVELELDLVRDEDATGLEGGVPADAPVLAVDGRGALEPGADVAEGVLRGAGGLEDDGDRLGDALDGQVAGDGPVVAVALDAGGDEGDVGVGLVLEEVSGAQVRVAVGVAGVDAAALD